MYETNIGITVTKSNVIIKFNVHYMLGWMGLKCLFIVIIPFTTLHDFLYSHAHRLTV